ncbi:MAG: xylulokinase [Deinococcota bacterium]
MFLGIDLGTGSVKALLLMPDGSVRAEASRRYDVNAPQPGWAESDPDAWWQMTCEAIQEACQKADSTDIQAIGLSGQMHGLVTCTAEGKPLCPAILWADGRSSHILDKYRELPEAMLTRLANPLATGMAGASLLWLKHHEPDVYEKMAWALQPKDWLRVKLTGEFAADPSDASATLLYDLTKNDWAADIVDALGLNSEYLAPLKDSAEVAGKLTQEAAKDLELPANIPVATGAGDASAALLGSGLLDEGAVQLTVGTAAQITAIRETPTVDASLRTHLYRAARPQRYFAMAAMQNAGLALEWVRRVLSLSWEVLYEEAFNVPAGSNGLIFVPHLSGERTPHLDGQARGAWVGLGLNHERSHMARAALEGVAFALKEGYLALQDVGISAEVMRLAGGGTTQRVWQELLATILETPLAPVDVPSASARGAAYLAALSVKALSDADIDNFSANLSPDPRTQIDPDPFEGELVASWQHYRALYPVLKRAREQVALT